MINTDDIYICDKCNCTVIKQQNSYDKWSFSRACNQCTSGYLVYKTEADVYNYATNEYGKRVFDIDNSIRRIRDEQ